MKNTFGTQQGDIWLRNRIGRITASRIVDVCSFLTRKSGDKEAGASTATRDSYRRELISERLTGRAKEHYNSLPMERGNQLEDSARLFYEDALRVMVEPVNFVLHPLYDFTGASPDGLVGSEGMIEIKCLLPWNHIEVLESREIEPQRFAQVGWQLACGGTERKWGDLVHWCPDIKAETMRFNYQRIGRDELEWTLPKIGERAERTLTGEAVIDYFTDQVLKLNAEIDYFMAEHGAKPVAPFPVQIVEEEAAGAEPEQWPEDLNDPAYAFVDGQEMVP
jgi:hypothetical protein